MIQLELNTSKPMQSCVNKALTLTVYKTNEPIEALGVTTYQGVIAYGDTRDHFPVESNSDIMGVELKRQRDVKPARVKKLIQYWKSSPGPVFPEICLFVNDLIIKDSANVFGATMHQVQINPDFDRFICDGQGRTTFINWLLEQENAAVDSQFTLAFKLIVTHTPDLVCHEASTIIKQVFADYHVSLIKPNKSISRSFNTASPFDKLCRELADSVLVNDKPLARYIALHGDIARGNIWTYEQYCSMLQNFLSVTPASANKTLANEGMYDKMKAVCERFLTLALNTLPLDTLDVDNFLAVHTNSIFTKAIFASALGLVGRSVMDAALDAEPESRDEIWAKLGTKLSMPLSDKDAPFWLKNNVTYKEEDSLLINRKSNRRIGVLICREINIFPCEQLLA